VCAGVRISSPRQSKPSKTEELHDRHVVIAEVFFGLSHEIFDEGANGGAWCLVKQRCSNSGGPIGIDGDCWDIVRNCEDFK